MKMPAILITVIFVISLATVSAAAAAVPAGRDCDGDRMFRRDGDDIDIDFYDGSLLIENEDEGETVEMTEDYELLVNGENVEIGRSQRKLVRAYYNKYEEVVDEAEEIGKEGGKLGEQGAKVAIHTLKKVLKSLEGSIESGDYEEAEFDEDIEREMEKAEKKIERDAKRLEIRAEKLEKKVDDLKKIHRKLREEVEELDDLGWF